MLPLTEDFQEAHRIWTAWRAVLEFDGATDDNPVISDIGCFDDFCHDFGLARTIRAGRRDDLRSFLKSEAFPLKECLADPTGALLDRQDLRIRPFFAPVGQNQSMRPPLSKVFWALRPNEFAACDHKTRLGFQLLSGSRELRNYVEFLDAFNALYRSVSRDVLSMCSDHGVPSNALARFVVVVGLARIGSTHQGQRVASSR